jgi:hypothetical protein
MEQSDLQVKNVVLGIGSHSNNTIKPVSLTILHQGVSPALHSPSIIIKNSHTKNTQTTNIPSFHHVPIIPSKLSDQIVINNMSLEEKERKRLELEEKERKRLEGDRLRSAKYNEKVKAYKKLGTLYSEKEKNY